MDRFTLHSVTTRLITTGWMIFREWKIYLRMIISQSIKLLHISHERTMLNFVNNNKRRHNIAFYDWFIYLYFVFLYWLKNCRVLFKFEQPADLIRSIFRMNKRNKRDSCVVASKTYTFDFNPFRLTFCPKTDDAPTKTRRNASLQGQPPPTQRSTRPDRTRKHLREPRTRAPFTVIIKMNRRRRRITNIFVSKTMNTWLRLIVHLIITCNHIRHRS